MQTLTLNRQALLALILATAFPLSALAGVGNVEFTTGTVNAQSADGATRTLSKGAEVNIGDTLKTLSGRMQVKFSDGGYISLQPNTEFTIDEYNYTGNKDGKEKGFFKLVKGGLRAITGAIGKTDKENYKVSTPTATIGIRGTEYVALQDGDRLQVKVGAGAVVIQNDAGNLVLYQGQSGEVSGPTSAPQQSTETPSVTAAAPGSNTVTETSEDSSTDSIYVDGNVRLDDDTLCQTGSGDCTATVIDEASNLVADFGTANSLLAGGLANIPLLGQINAVAAYTSANPNTISFGGGTVDVDESLFISFSDLTVEFEIEADNPISGGTYSGQFLSATANGSLSSSGAFSFQESGESTVSSSPGFSGTPLVLSGSGSLGSSNLSQATVSYTLGLTNGTTLASVSNILLDGIAFIDSPTLLQDLAQGGLVNIPALGALNAFGTYSSTSAISLMGFTGTLSEGLTVGFADLSSFLSISDGSSVFLNASGSLNADTGQIDLTPLMSSGPLTLDSASANLNSSNLSRATINYTVSDGQAPQSVTKEIQGAIFSGGN